MSLKAKLATTIAALCMVICLLTVGVFAANQATVNLKGNVSFTATDVNVSVYGAISGTLGANVGNTGVATIVTEDPEGDATPDHKIAEWNALSEGDTLEETWADPALDLSFAKKDSTIVVVIKVKNNDTVRGVNYTFAPTLGGTTNTIAAPKTGEGVDPLTVVAETNLKASYAVSGADVDTENTLIPAGKTAVFTITIEIADRNVSVDSVELAGALVLDDAGAPSTNS